MCDICLFTSSYVWAPTNVKNIQIASIHNRIEEEIFIWITTDSIQLHENDHIGVDKIFLPFKDPRPALNKQYSRVEAQSLLLSSRIQPDTKCTPSYF